MQRLQMVIDTLHEKRIVLIAVLSVIVATRIFDVVYKRIKESRPKKCKPKTISEMLVKLRIAYESGIIPEMEYVRRRCELLNKQSELCDRRMQETENKKRRHK